jgi:carbamate kinase
MESPVVIALGGNALIAPGQRGTVPEQFANTRRSLDRLEGFLRRGCPLVITHGNGPQVGNIVIRVEEARNKAYEVPLGVCVAESQGEVGYMIAQSLKNKLDALGDSRDVAAVLTQVLVDPHDPQLTHPTKPIGPFYGESEVATLEHRGLPYMEDSGRGYRRVVPSPRPLATVEKDVVRKLLEAGVVVVAAGGGGMPVYRDASGRLEGIDAVIDKDLASAVLAREIGAVELVILTSVDNVCLHYGTENEVRLGRIDAKEMQRHLDAGHFADGSMAPKVEAALTFLASGGRKTVITSAEGIEKILAGDENAGTTIVRESGKGKRKEECPSTSCA